VIARWIASSTRPVGYRRPPVIYMEQGDKMGYLWKQGFFTGVDPA